MNKSVLIAGMGALLLSGSTLLSVANAQTILNPSAPKMCAQSDISTTIAAMSTKLKKSNQENQARLMARLRELAKARGWTEADTEEKGLDLLEDDETRVQDETSSHLLSQIDQLGQTSDTAPTCAKVEELKALTAQLVEVTGAKASHISAKLDTELKAARGTVASAVEPKSEAKKSAPPIAIPADPARPPAKPAPEQQTASAVKTNDAYVPPAALPTAPAVVDPVALEFSVDDIRAAGRGFFGTLSAELAAVIEYTFKSYGRPTGYILGTEGGVALLAGLRYGDGQLVTKLDGERKVYWQGPSVGYDFGLTGSRTMILIYGLRTPADMYQRFGGIDGSAYLVGGAGVTVLKKGPLILAPIRTGVGLRLGANVGYLHFTPRPRFNPF